MQFIEQQSYSGITYRSGISQYKSTNENIHTLIKAFILNHNLALNPSKILIHII